MIRQRLQRPMTRSFQDILLMRIIRRITLFIKSMRDYVEYALIKGREYDSGRLARVTQIENEDQFKELLKKRKALLRTFDEDYTAGNYDLLFPGKKQEKIDAATLVCQHVFDLLSSGPKRLSPLNKEYRPIDWHWDFKSGYRWPPYTFHNRIRYGDKPGVDVKVPWELSRFQHLTLLGQAYVLTKDKRYADEFKNQIVDWINNNKVGFGVNWSSTMDVAIRAANWLIAQEYFYDESVFPETFWRPFFLSIYEHGRYIRRHLEKGPPKVNHYLSNIVGLFFISLYCPFLEESAKWKPFCIKELEREIYNQVYDDGCHFEGSTSYHRLALELFFYAELLAKRAGIEFSPTYHNKLMKMFDFSLYGIKPDGKIPQIGDNDNGRFLVFSSRPILDHTYLLCLASIFYQDSSFKLRAFSYDDEAFWVFGKEGHEIWSSLPYREQKLCSKAFLDSGWNVLRHGNTYCLISCGNKRYNSPSGHRHNDRMSFELMINGMDIIVDPGTFVYSSDPGGRNRFRSTEYHNTLVFEDQEQCDLPHADLFSLPDKVLIVDSEIEETVESVLHHGEIRYADIIHKRRIVLNKTSGSFQITDTWSRVRPSGAKLMFHLSPEVLVEGEDVYSKKSWKKIAHIHIEGYRMEKHLYDYSPEYGSKSEAECLSVRLNAGKKPMTVHTFIHCS